MVKRMIAAWAPTFVTQAWSPNFNDLTVNLSSSDRAWPMIIILFSIFRTFACTVGDNLGIAVGGKGLLRGGAGCFGIDGLGVLVVVGFGVGVVVFLLVGEGVPVGVDSGVGSAILAEV